MQAKSIREKCLGASLALCLLLSCLPVSCAMGGGSIPRPDQGSCGPNATYSLKDGVLTISGTGEVTAYYDSWPQGVTSVVIEEGITSLSNPAFRLLNITAVEIPDSMAYISDGAFSATPWLDAQTEEFFIVGDGILLDYNGPGGEVTIPDTVRSIAGGAFAKSDITEITVGSHVDDIGAGAFANCPNLERVSISETISHIEGDILFNTPWLRAQTEDFVIVGDGVLIAYKGHDSAVKIPDTVHTIAGFALWPYDEDGNSRENTITEVIIPDTVTEIAYTALSTEFSVKESPVIIHGMPGSAAEKFAGEQSAAGGWIRFVPFGQGDGSLVNFTKVNDYVSFPDVDVDDWFYDTVKTTYNLGLMQGSNGKFNPTGNIMLCEAITIAARVRDIYYYEQTDFKAADGVTWYQPYMDYAIAHGMLEEVPADPLRPATRGELARLLATALPEREFEPVSSGIDFVDIDETHPAYAAAQTMAQAGIMQGRGNGHFAPDATLMRCEAAATLARCVQPELRRG